MERGLWRGRDLGRGMYSFERGRTTRAISIGFTAQQPVLVPSRKRLGPPPPELETLAVLMDLHWESVRTDLHTNTQAERNRKRVAHEIDLLPTAMREGFFSRDRPPLTAVVTDVRNKQNV